MKAINLDLDKLSEHSSSSSESTQPPKVQEVTTKHEQKKPNSFWKSQAQKFKEEYRTSGTFYNLALGSLITFIVVFVLLCIFKPPMVMITEKGQEPKFCITSTLIWSLIASCVVFCVGFFTRPKK